MDWAWQAAASGAVSLLALALLGVGGRRRREIRMWAGASGAAALFACGLAGLAGDWLILLVFGGVAGAVYLLALRRSRSATHTPFWVWILGAVSLLSWPTAALVEPGSISGFLAVGIVGSVVAFRSTHDSEGE